MIRRLTTPDMMFGLEVAPSLSSSSVAVETSDVSTLLNCFKETGSPVAGNLSPIAMVMSVEVVCNNAELLSLSNVTLEASFTLLLSSSLPLPPCLPPSVIHLHW